MMQDDVIASQDRQRTARSFINFLSVATGSDGSLSTDDGSIANDPYRYQTVTPYGVSTTGAAVSNIQPRPNANASPLIPLLLAAAVLSVLAR